MSPANGTDSFDVDRQRTGAHKPAFELTLFVNGASDRSAIAILDARRVCEISSPDDYDLRVIDVHDDLSEAVALEVFAIPALVKTHPGPLRQVVGDLSRTEVVARALGMVSDAVATAALE